MTSQEGIAIASLLLLFTSCSDAGQSNDVETCPSARCGVDNPSGAGAGGESSHVAGVGGEASTARSGSGGASGAAPESAVTPEPVVVAEPALAPEPSSCTSAVCGGDLVGQWFIGDYCGWDALEDSSSLSGCPGIMIDASGLRLSGEIRFEESADYTSFTTLSGALVVTYPPECLSDPASGLTITCAELTASLQEALDEAPEASMESASCVGTSGCDCTFEMTQYVDESGTFSTSGTTLTVIPDGGEPTQSEYCVDGIDLTIQGNAESSSRAVGPSMVLRPGVGR